MIRDIDVALYFLSLDKDHSLFNKVLQTRNGRIFYEGNARLNKYMQLAQNIFIGKYQKPLMDSVFYAYDNGAVDTKVQENYSVLLDRRDQGVELPEADRKFLDKIYKVFQNATLDELIEMSHEDPEWIAKHNFHKKEDQRMDSMAHKDEYAKQYEDMIKVMERMDA